MVGVRVFVLVQALCGILKSSLVDGSGTDPLAGLHATVARQLSVFVAHPPQDELSKFLRGLGVAPVTATTTTTTSSNHLLRLAASWHAASSSQGDALTADQMDDMLFRLQEAK